MTSLVDAVGWIEDLVGWRVDLPVANDVLTAVDGDGRALEGVLRRADDPTELLARPHRPLEILATRSEIEAVAGHDDGAIRVALLHILAEGDVTGRTAALHDVDDVDEALAAALDGRLLRRIPGGVAGFDRATDAVVWSGASEAKRTWALDRLAHHTERDDSRAWYRAWAALGPDPEVAESLAATADEALATGATADAASALEVASVLTPDRQRSITLLLRAAEVFFVGGMPRHALSLLRRSVAHVDAGTAAAMHRMIGRILLFDGDLRAAETHLLAHARPFGDGDEDLGSLLAAEALWVRAVDGRLAEALPLITPGGPPRADAPLFVRSCWTGLRNMLGTGVDRSELELRFEEFSSISADDPEHTMLGYVILQASIGLEAFDIAHDVLTMLLQHDLAPGSAPNRALVLAGAAELAWWQGDWSTARTWARESLDTADRQHDTISPARAVLALGRIQYASDEGAAASALLEQRLETVPGWSRPALLAALGHGHLVAGRIDRAIADLAAAVAAETQPGHGLPHPKLSAVGPDYCEALIAAGRADDARAWLDRWRGGAAATGTWERGTARRCDALLETGRDAADAGAEAIELLEPFPFEQARALLEQGRRLFADGDFDGARAALRAALPRFIGLGASTWSRATENALDRLAGDAASSLERDLARLSEQDRRIVRYVAAGNTNRQVAEQLHLSPKTIENRLTAIYATLGLRNRVELARRLGG